MRVVVGRIGRPHGLKGDVTVEVRTDEPELHFQEDEVLLTENGELCVEYAWYHGKILCVKFVGFNDRTAAESLRNTILEIERDELERPEDPDEYYDAQLIGLSVLDGGESIGTVKEVIHTPVQDLLAVSTESGEVLVPFVAEIVGEIDLTAKSIEVELPPGLLEVNRAD